MSTYNDIGIGKDLDWARIKKLFIIGLIAGIMVLVGDMLLGWGEADDSISGMAGALSAYVTLSDTRIFWSSILGFIGIPLEGLCYFGIYRLIAPYSEKYAYLIGKQLGFNVVPYKISRWNGNVCSVCKLFTSKELSYVPIGRIVRKGGMKAVREYYRSLGSEFIEALNEMIVFDALICNTDRHFGNFGVMVDSRTNKIVAPAPLFDHGNSLFNFAGEENWKSEELLDSYASTLLPAIYDDFFEEAPNVLGGELSQKVRKALSFTLEEEGKYLYPRRKVRLIEKQISKRATRILKE